MLGVRRLDRAETRALLQPLLQRKQAWIEPKHDRNIPTLATNMRASNKVRPMACNLAYNVGGSARLGKRAD